MKRFAERAEWEIDTGLGLDPQNLAGYAILLGVRQFGGWSREYQSTLERALDVFPDSYVLRAVAMSAMQPRWGGSFQRMRRSAEEAAELVDQNPRLAVLRGYPLAERARIHRRSKEFPEAVYFYNRALEHGDEWFFFLGRGKTYYYAEDYPRALEDLLRAARQRPQHPEILEMKGRTLYQLSRAVPPMIRGTVLDRAIEDFEVLHAIRPTDENAAKWLNRLRTMKSECERAPVVCT